MEKNKYLKIGILSLFFVFAFVGFSFAQVTLSLRYSNTDSKYHVFLTATQALQAVSNPKLTDGSTLITVIAPTGGNLTVGTVTSVSPSGSWDLTTTQRNNGDVGSGAPANTDFFAFTPAGDFTSINYTVGQEIELFNFDVTGVCTGSLDILPSAGQTAGGGTQNIGSYYSVKGYAGSIGTNHFSATYNMSAACPTLAASNITISLGQPMTPFVAGSPSNVPVTLTNSGTAPDAGAITSTITLPAGFTTTMGTFSPVVGTTCSTSGQVVTCQTAGPLSNVSPSNTTSFNLPITPAASTVGTTPTTTASVSSPNEPVANQTNNTAAPMSPTTAVAPNTAPDVVTTIGQPLPTLVVGQASNLPVTVTNQGTAPATGPITTIITLPAGVTTSPVFVSNGFTCSTVLQVVTCFTSGPLTHLAPSNTVIIQVPITPDATIVGTNPVFNATTAVQNEPAATLPNNTSAPTPTTSAVAPVPASNIIVTIGQPATPFVAGSPSNVPVTISNIGNISDAGAFTTTITLPAGFSTTSGNFSPVVGTTCSTVGQVVTCSTTGPLSSVVGSNTKAFNLPITPAASTIGTTPTTSASVSSPNEPVANNTNNTTSMWPTTAVVAAPAPDLVTVIGQPLTPFVAGSSSIVPVTVTNQGTAPANGPITTTITLPAGMSAPALFTSNGNTCNTTGQVIVCSHPGPISNVSPSNTTIIEVPVTPMAATVGTKPGPFTATPTAPNEPAANTGNNTAPNMTPAIAVVAAPIVAIRVNVKVFLQGAYDNTTGLMRDDLRTKNLLPTAQPYSAMPRTAYHTGTETATSPVFATTGSNAIVDWVLVELRTGTSAATRIATRAALVQRDGDVVDIDGTSPLAFANQTAGNYYVAVTHRNHLGAMSEVAVALSATASTVDFTGAYDGYGNNAMKAIGNLNALWAGNANLSGITHRNVIFSGANNDSDGVKNDILTHAANAAQNYSFVPSGYYLGDTNLDGDVKYQGLANDVDALIFFNVIDHPSNAADNPLFIISEQH